MEPAEYRPDDRNAHRDHGVPTHAAMEPAEYRPDDDGRHPGNPHGTLAAMEPAEYRPDDGRLTRTAVAGQTWPQWSRPSIGRMTSWTERHGSRQRAAMEPAEYRPDDIRRSSLFH